MPKGIKGFQKGHKINIGKKYALGKHWKMTEEHKKKISERRKGIKFSKKHRQHLSESLRCNVKINRERDYYINYFKSLY